MEAISSANMYWRQTGGLQYTEDVNGNKTLQAEWEERRLEGSSFYGRTDEPTGKKAWRDVPVIEAEESEEDDEEAVLNGNLKNIINDAVGKSLRTLGFSPRELKMMCLAASEKHVWILRDAYLYSAVNILWSLNDRPSIQSAVIAALGYLERDMGNNVAPYQRLGQSYKAKYNKFVEKVNELEVLVR